MQSSRAVTAGATVLAGGFLAALCVHRRAKAPDEDLDSDEEAEEQLRQLDEDVHEEPRQPPRPMLSKKRSSLAATLHNVFSGDDVDEEESVVFRSLSSYSSLPVFRSISTQEPQSVERGPSVSRGGSITFAGEGRRSRLTRALFAGPQKTPRYSKTPPFSLITCRRPHRARLPHLECERDEDQRRRCAKVDHIGRQSRRLFCRIPGTPLATTARWAVLEQPPRPLAGVGGAQRGKQLAVDDQPVWHKLARKASP